MAYAFRPADFHAASPHQPAPQPSARRRGFWRGLVDALMIAHQKDAQREIDRFVARRGKFTDSVEREIGERITSGDWTVRR